MNVIIYNSWGYDALYRDGVFVSVCRDSVPDDVYQTLDGERKVYWMPDDVYDDALNGAGYPRELDDLPLDRMEDQTNKFKKVYG